MLDINDKNLRDWFAGMALQGMLAAGANWHAMYLEDTPIAYKMADAMMKEREKAND